MTMKKQLVILANKYPNEFDPNINVFTQQTAWTFADLGYECVVVCPSAVNLNKINRKLPSETIETTEQGNSVRIVRPHYLSMGQRPGPFNKQRVAFTVAHYIVAIEKALRDYSIDPALFFGEFLCPCGVAAAKLGKVMGIHRSSSMARHFIMETSTSEMIPSGKAYSLTSRVLWQFRLRTKVIFLMLEFFPLRRLGYFRTDVEEPVLSPRQA